MRSHNKDSAQDCTDRQILTFRLGAETFGLEILGAKNIRGWMPATSIPGYASQAAGVVNLQGNAVTVLDLRLHLALAEAEHNASSVIIALSLQGTCETRDIDIVVDCAAEVLGAPGDALQAAPDSLAQDVA